MAASQYQSSLNCELRIIEAENTKSISTGKLFVRCYLSGVGNNEKIRLNSKEIPSTSHPYWNESISLECSATKDCMKELKQQSVVFELRWRNKTTILGRIGRSKLLGRAVLLWKDVLESSELIIERWVTMVVATRSHVLEGLNQPVLHVEMKVGVPGTMEKVKKRRWGECGCRHEGCDGGGDDLFALASALEAL
ncbi:uncharacterized protein LOC122057047 [Macadamia integrifolia]|uniref:uncharacterized protein LOC122057047 n=1 Tax=Macadamia integrifolia TaxID=60698 RepID=UPI001C4EAD57|nr:uncharacterized protein LOC122057047 [Macadamia integrifolia]